MVSERSLQVLHAIVNDYVASSEPVGSKSLVTRHQFGVSAATIRNDMALLEDEELIVAPHTSSGRVPTDKGYRLYVDTLQRARPISSAQRAAIERFLGESYDLDEVMQRTVRLLAQLTNEAAVVQYPMQKHVIVRHVELVPVAAERVLSVLITGSGLVEQQVVTLPAAEVAETWVNGLRDRIAEAVVGHEIGDAKDQIHQLEASVDQWTDGEESSLVHKILSTVADQLEAGRPQRLSVAGTANLSRAQDLNFGSVLEALEEQVTMLRLFGELTDGEITASIGQENEPYGFTGAAVIASRYDEEASHIGVLGPTRMDYAGNITAVRAVARYLRKLLGENE
jgi:heat-inducible transcriptional repressor